MVHRRMNLLNLLALFAVPAIIFYAFRSDTDQIVLDVLPTKFDDRLVRAAPDDKLKDSIEKLQKVARLTNALYLQIGLTTGNVFDSEELISELLHFGAVTPKGIQNIKFTEIENAFDALKALPGKFEKNGVIDKIEKKFLNVKKILNEMKEVPKAGPWEGKNDYAADLEKITNGNVKFEGDVQELMNEVGDWIHHHKRVSRATSDPTVSVHLDEWKTNCEKLKKAASSLQSNFPIIFEFKNGKKAENAISSLVKVESSIVLLLAESFSIDDDEFDQLQTYFQPASKFVTQIKTVRPDIDVVGSVHFYRLNPGLSPTFKYTPGLLGGYEDVTILSEDFKDAWFKQVVKNNSIAKAFPSVSTLVNTVSGIQRLLDKPTSEPLEILRAIFLESDKFQRFSKFPIEDAKTIAKCIEGVPHRFSNSFVTELSALAKKIDEQFEEFNRILKSSAKAVFDQQNNIESLIEELNKVDQSDLQSAYKHILSLNSAQNIENIFKRLDFKGLLTDSLVGFANQSIYKLNELDDYHTTVENHYGYIQCLLDNKEKASKVTKIIGESNNLPSLQNNAYNDKIDMGQQYVKRVANTLDGLKSLTTEIKSAEGDSNLETKPLKTFNQTDAIAIGFATRAVANMKALIDRKSEFEVFKTHSNLVQNEKNKHSSKFQPDELPLLDNIVTLGSSLDTMYSELDIWKNAINAQSFSTLDSFSEVFEEAAKVKGLGEDLTKMTTVLQKLIEFVEAEASSTRRKRSTDNLNEIKTALDSLNGLQFSKYSSNFADSKGTLSSIDMFFANYIKDLMKLLSPPIPPSQIQRIQKPGTSKEEVEIFEKERNIKIGCGVGGFVLFVIIAIILFFVGRRWWRRRKMPCNQIITSFTFFNLKPRVALRYLRNLKKQIDAIKDVGGVKEAREGETRFEQKKRDNAFYRFCESIITASMDGRREDLVAPYDELVNQMLVSFNVRADSAIKLDPGDNDSPAHTFYHGNLMTMRNFFKVILMQGAINSNTHQGKETTIHKLWKLVKKYKVKTIVMLSNLENATTEGSRYFALNVNNSFNFDSSIIKCNACNEDTEITTRQLEYFVNEKDKKGYEVTHYQHTRWNDRDIPKTKGIRKVLELVRASEGPVMVHCNDGVGRTGAFVYAEKLLQAIHFSKGEDGNVDHGELIREMRESRACCIQRPENLMVPIMTVMDMCFENTDVKKLKSEKETKKKDVITEEDYKFYQDLRHSYLDIGGHLQI